MIRIKVKHRIVKEPTIEDHYTIQEKKLFWPWRNSFEPWGYAEVLRRYSTYEKCKKVLDWLVSEEIKDKERIEG